MATDWTPVATAGIAAASALTGGVVSAWVQHRASSQRELAARSAAARDDRAARLAEALELAERVRAIYVSVAAQRPGALDHIDDVVVRLMSVRAQLQLLVGPSVWVELKPLLNAVATMANYLSLKDGPVKLTRAAMDEMSATGVDTAEGWNALWKQFVVAARIDLGLAGEGQRPRGRT